MARVAQPANSDDTMMDDKRFRRVPVNEQELRKIAKVTGTILPNFEDNNPRTGVKDLHDIIDPVLETADLPDLEPGHRAAASNALCSVIEKSWASGIRHVQDAILEDSIWLRGFHVYLHKSGNAKGKSMKQLLVVLTSLLVQDSSIRASELRQQAASLFLDIIFERNDRTMVKPALQGLAHFLLKDVITIDQLVQLNVKQSINLTGPQENTMNSQDLFKIFLGWTVHHDTSLSAGHLVKNFLLQARRLPANLHNTLRPSELPLWVVPVVQTFQHWPDRIQELRTHVFPHCFQPNLDEYLQFLSYLHLEKHIGPGKALPSQFRSFSHLENGLASADEFELILAAIVSGKELTIVHDSDHRLCDTIEVRNGAIYLPDHVPGTWMSHAEPGVRLAGMFLSVYSISVTRPLAGGVLTALRRNLVHLHTESDADFRREVLGYMQKLFDRLRASTATSAKRKLNAKQSIQRLRFPATISGYERNLVPRAKNTADDESLQFIVWFLNFLEWELRATASYQRRIVALRALTVVLRSGLDDGTPKSYLSKSAQGDLNWAHGLRITNSRLLRILFDLILDPFDDVRDAAVSVIHLCLVSLSQTEADNAMATFPRFLARAEETMLRTGRADHADGVARAYGLIFAIVSDNTTQLKATRCSSKLEVFRYLKQTLSDTLSVAHNNLAEAVDGRPVHGIFAALRYIIDRDEFYANVLESSIEALNTWKQIHHDVLESIESLWACVQHVLCADAPEGHVPDEVEDDAGLDTKEILSYSWRALKEASTLLRTIISRAPIGLDEKDFITPELFARFGRLCFIQLLELRHRGAFSTVSQTFVALCRRCTSSNVPELRALPQVWYKETLQSIKAKANAITRRSAGIPAAMIALLAAEPQAGGPFFQRAIKDLTGETLVEAQSANIEDSRLPQVHALNCIKEIFTTSRLSVASEAYIGQGLELAARTLNSNIWPLRNCSLMLFKALIERLLGSDEAQDWKERERAKTSRFSYDNYPSLPSILSKLLDPTGPLQKSLKSTSDNSSPLDLHGAEGVFPALQILRQARPSEPHLSPIRNFVCNLFASPHWHLRDMASRTFVSLNHASELHAAAVDLLAELPHAHNIQHGTLLAIKHLAVRLSRDPLQLDAQSLQSQMNALTRAASSWYSTSDCGFIRSTFLDIVSQSGLSMLHRGDANLLPSWNQLATSVSLGPGFSLSSRHLRGNELLRNSLARAFFVDRVILQDKPCSQTGSGIYQSIEDALILLAQNDPDTCCATIDTLSEVLKIRPWSGSGISHSLLTSHILRVVLEATDLEVISKAQAVLADTLGNEDLKIEFLNLLSKHQVMSTLERLQEQCLQGPPSNMQSALRLIGSFLDTAYQQYQEEFAVISNTIARYIRILRMTTIDTNPFDTRFAAVQSLASLTHIWTLPTSSSASTALLLGLSFLLLDTLSDDDDEIRDLAATATAAFLRAQGHHTFTNTVPLLTSHRLATFLSKTFPENPFLHTECLRRLTSTPSPTRLFSIPFATAFQAASKQDTALFAQERQNLYKDDALDAVLYARILSALPAATAARTPLANALRTWTLAALAFLAEKSSSTIDGALGWSSKPEVFALGMRVFCAAEVLLAWGVGRREVLLALRRFADAAVEGEVHGLWVQRVEGVLAREVLGGLVRIKSGLLNVTR
ncbi:hypothetical protein ACN47E_008435 [Coniothyrium glycines]